MLSIKKNSKFKNYILLIFLLFAFLEISSFFVLKFILANYGIIFDKNRITQDHNNYLKIRNDILGWDAIGESDKDGARKDHSSYKDSEPCIDVYGDSFTYGHPKGEYAWPSLLSDRLKCRVRNFGVSGYGTDQAHIKFLLRNNHSKIVILNHLSENIIRNLNQFRNFIYPIHQFSFKPRFIIDDDELKLISTPKIPNEKIFNFLKQPEKYLNNEYFIPNGPSGIQHLGFPYSIKVLKSFNHWHVQKKIRNIPVRYIEFYSQDHSSKGLKLTNEIMNDFYNQATASGLTAILTVFPTCRDLEYFSEHRKYPYESLINLFEQTGIKYIDFGPIFISRNKNNFENLYQECRGHFNEEGEALISEVIYEYIHDNDLLKKIN